MGILSDFGVESSISGLNPRTAAEHLCLELPEDTLALLLKGKWAPILDSPSPSQGGGRRGGGRGHLSSVEKLLGSLRQGFGANLDNMLKTSLSIMF